MLKAIKAIKLTVAWSLNCLHVIVCVTLRCPGELTNTIRYDTIGEFNVDSKAGLNPQGQGQGLKICPRGHLKAKDQGQGQQC